MAPVCLDSMVLTGANIQGFQNISELHSSQNWSTIPISWHPFLFLNHNHKTSWTVHAFLPYLSFAYYANLSQTTYKKLSSICQLNYSVTSRKKIIIIIINTGNSKLFSSRSSRKSKTTLKRIICKKFGCLNQLLILSPCEMAMNYFPLNLKICYWKSVKTNLKRTQ